ncbi:MAG: hypothetical protein LQ345_006389 [Seirophora villosa]|nr:MAG: hypothetical protein LQ345_006389 [Seirophora villosa]
MNFTIEVPGEANPLSIQTLYHTLTAASSTDPQQIKSATQQLQNWEKQAGYYSSLQTIFVDTSLPVQVRYLCIIQLKNGIDRYWRKTAPNAIQKDEKNQIRARSIESGTKEPDARLALQNALMIAKIIRHEYPLDWPEAVSTIVSNLRSASQPTRNNMDLARALLILLEAIKELSTARIQRTRASLQAAAVEVLQVLGKIYVDKVQTWTNFFRHGGDDEGGAIDSIEQSLVALRVLRRLLVAGWDFPNRSPEVEHVWVLLINHFHDMLSLAADGSSSLHESVRLLVEKHLRQIAKLHQNLAKNHPAGFALLPGSTQLVSAYWSLIARLGESFGSHTLLDLGGQNGMDRDADDANVPIMEYLSLKGLLLLRECVKMVFNPAQTFKYQQAHDKEEKTRSRELIKGDLLTEDFAQTTMQTLVTRYFVFRPRDLREWEEQPEEWERREEGEDDIWEFSIRSCAEKLFLELMLNYKAQLVPTLLSVFGKVAYKATQNTNMFLKESVYGAIGLGAAVLEDEIDFNSFLNETLAREVQVSQSGYNILRRRIAIVLGKWLPVKDGLNRPLVYQIFQHLLDKQDPLNDLVVRITAGRQLKNIISPFEFTFEGFRPYCATVLGHLMALIEEVELSETKLALLNTLSTLVQSVEDGIVPFADHIISLLPPLWEQAGAEFLMKQSILGILSSLMSSMKGSSQKYHSLIIPLVDSSVDISSETRIYLLDDAMDLWATVLQQTPPAGITDVVPLVPHLFPMLEVGSDTLRRALEITEIYVYLAPSQVLASFDVFLPPFVGLLEHAKREATGLVLAIVDKAIQSALMLGGKDALTTLTSQLLQFNLLQTIVAGLRGAHQAHQSSGPNRSKTWLDVLVETDYLSILSRLTVTSPDLFLEALKAATPNEELNVTIKWLLSEWFGHLDNISHPEKKKLNCLALTTLLQTGQPWIMVHLQELMAIWTETVLDLYDEPDSKETDCLVYKDPRSLEAEEETAAKEGQRKLLLIDPVHQLDLRGFIREHLECSISASGGSEAFQTEWVVNVDGDVLQDFGKLGIF